MNSIFQFDQVTFGYTEKEEVLFNQMSLGFPEGVTSLIGQNGVGKSTFMLLAGGRLIPQTGNVTILGQNTKDLTDENQKNKLVSFVYQNMEFETQDKFGDLMPLVFQSGNMSSGFETLAKDIINNLGLAQGLNKKTQEMSKGELQRAIIAFSLLYGSPIIMMDEPVFALEADQKEKTLGFLNNYAHTSGISILYSIHELQLSQKYSQNIALFYKDGRIEIGSREEVFQNNKIEEAYQVPMDMLHKKENLYRQQLKSRELSPEMEEIIRKNN